MDRDAEMLGEHYQIL